MYFSEPETKRRFDLLRAQMREHGLDAVLLVNHGAFNFFQEEFYLLQNDFIPAGDSITLVPRVGEPVVLSTYLQAISNSKQSTVRDARVIDERADPAECLAEVLREKGLGQAKVGLRRATTRLAWYEVLSARFPELQLIDIGGMLTDVFYEKSAEEAEAARRSARIADAAYENLLRTLRPGMTEAEVVAEFEHCSAQLGANRNFTIIASGPFGGDVPYPELAPPTRRTIEVGDSVVLEMTPASAGYYTQLVRSVDVGRPNPLATRLSAVAIDAIEAARRVLAPGVTIGEVARELIRNVQEAGHEIEFPIGHTVGVNLVYDRLLPDVERVLHEHDVLIIHPKSRTPDGLSSFFWGETYLVTAEGNEPLHRASREVQTVAAPWAAPSPVPPVVPREPPLPWSNGRERGL